MNILLTNAIKELEILYSKKIIIFWNITSDEEIFFKYKIDDEEFDDYVKLIEYKKITSIIDKTKIEILNSINQKREDEEEYIRNCCPSYGFY